MNFTHYNLGVLSGGETVVVTLQGTAANVRLMDSINFSASRTGGQHRYFGGTRHARRFACRCRVAGACPALVRG